MEKRPVRNLMQSTRANSYSTKNKKKKKKKFWEDHKVNRSKCQTEVKTGKEEKKILTLEIQTEFLLCNSKLNKPLRKCYVLLWGSQFKECMDQREQKKTSALENVTYRKDLNHGVSSAWKGETEKTNINNIKYICKKDRKQLFFMPVIAGRTKRLKLHKWIFRHWKNSLTLLIFQSWNRQQGGM